MPFFSIIIPIYNAECFLNRCLVSVREQSFIDFEVIMINDGSKDSSGEIAERYAKEDERFWIIQQENRGSLLTRTGGVKYAKGKYLLFLDADDFWERDLLSTAYEMIQKYTCDMIMFRYQCVDESGKKLYVQRALLPNETVIDNAPNFLIEQLATTFEYNTMCLKVIKSELIDSEKDYGVFGRLAMGDDALQSLQSCFKCQRFIYLEKVLYNYTINRVSQTHTIKPSYLKDYITLRMEIEKYVKQLWTSEDKIFHDFRSYTLRGFFACLSDLAYKGISKQIWQECYKQVISNPLYLKCIENIGKLNFKGKVYSFLLKIDCYTVYKLLNKVKIALKFIYEHWKK